MHINSTKPISR